MFSLSDLPGCQLRARKVPASSMHPKPSSILGIKNKHNLGIYQASYFITKLFLTSLENTVMNHKHFRSWNPDIVNMCTRMRQCNKQSMPDVRIQSGSGLQSWDKLENTYPIWMAQPSMVLHSNRLLLVSRDMLYSQRNKKNMNLLLGKTPAP